MPLVSQCQGAQRLELWRTRAHCRSAAGHRIPAEVRWREVPLSEDVQAGNHVPSLGHDLFKQGLLMKPPPFEYEAPSSVDEAVDLLRELGGDAKVIAGGQSLIPMLNMRLAAPSYLIDINGISDLGRIQTVDGWVRIGAGVRQRDVERSEDVFGACPLLRLALGNMSHPTIRNRGTVVGSLMHADSAAELPAVLALLGGTVRVVSHRDEREIRAEELFVGPFETSTRADELAVEAAFPVIESTAGFAFEEIAWRKGDFAICAVAAIASGDGSGKVAFSGVAPAPRVVDVSEALGGDVESAAAAAVEGLDPPSDIHASAEFRLHLARVLVTRTLTKALSGVDG